MLWKQWWFMLLFYEANAMLYCFNCSSTNRDWSQCGGDVVVSAFPFNRTHNSIVNCTGENAMCYVRSWSARARHSWIVQRGCYRPDVGDPLPSSVGTKTPSCTYERYAGAEYKVCLCQSDWCNSASKNIPSIFQYFTKLYKIVIEMFIAMYLPVITLFV